MRLIEAFDFVGDLLPTWKTARGAWRKPFIYNRGHALRILGTDKNVKKITKADLRAMQVTLEREGRANGGVNRIMSMINTLLKELQENDVITTKIPKIPPLDEKGAARTGYYTKENIEEMVKAAREVFINHELADAIIFSVFTGCRQANMLNLEVRDVDFGNDTIRFRDTKQGDEYVVDIHKDMREMLAMRCANEAPHSKVFQFKNKDELWTQFKKVRNYVGLPKTLVWHSLRHTCGTWLASKNVPVQTIAEVLGHKTLEMSMRYTHITNEARKAAVNTL